MDKLLSEQLKRSKTLMGLREDVDTTTPKFKVSRGLLDIDGSRYKLETEKAWVRIGIDIIKVSPTNQGIALTVKNPVTGSHITNEIRKSNVDKVLQGASNNEDEITVENLEGREFFLVRV